MYQAVDGGIRKKTQEQTMSERHLFVCVFASRFDLTAVTRIGKKVCKLTNEHIDDSKHRYVPWTTYEQFKEVIRQQSSKRSTN